MVGLVLIAMLVASGGLAEVRALDRRRAGGLLALAIIGGSIPFILFFSGLAEATGPGAAFIHKTLFIWVAALAMVFLGERLGIAQVVAMGVLFAGVVLVGPAGTPSAGLAELLILAATLLWAVEVVIARRLLGDEGVSIRLAATSRMALGALVIVGFLVVTGRISAIATFTLDQWAVIGATGMLLLGYVTTWYAALQRAPASLVTTVLVAGAIITAVLASLRSGQLPAPAVEAGLVLLAVAVAMAAWSGARDRPEQVRA
jgi:drug/metabolite transporter (DMT)-like permease